LSLGLLAVLGGGGAYVGGAPVWKAVIRISFWGGVAMGITASVGALFGAVT
jgi:VIT1/CCC1 family predicted Fe2+/Mn2+ transporter